MSMFSLLFCSTVVIYLEGSAFLSHPTGVPHRDPHNDGIGDLILSLKTLISLSLLTVTETFTSQGRVLYTCLVPLCSAEVEASVSHRTFYVTEKLFLWWPPLYLI